RAVPGCRAAGRTLLGSQLALAAAPARIIGDEPEDDESGDHEDHDHQECNGHDDPGADTLILPGRGRVGRVLARVPVPARARCVLLVALLRVTSHIRAVAAVVTVGVALTIRALIVRAMAVWTVRAVVHLATFPS